MGARLVALGALLALCMGSIVWGQPVTVSLGSIAIVSGCQQINPAKVEAALTLALQASQRFHLTNIPDTLPPAASTPERSACTLHTRIDCFQSLLRAEIQLVFTDTTQRGTGYGLVRHRWEESQQPLADPALLEAIERALCSAAGDSLLYVRHDSTAVRPASLVAVTNIELRDNPSLPRWELFEDALATSYSGILAAITGAQQAPAYVVLDIDTRDSIYAHFRLYEPEPGMPPSKEELAALDYFGVDAIISGSLKRTVDGAVLELRLMRIRPNGTVAEVARVERTLTDDSRVAYLEAIARAARELLRSPLPLSP